MRQSHGVPVFPFANLICGAEVLGGGPAWSPVVATEGHGTSQHPASVANVILAKHRHVLVMLAIWSWDIMGKSQIRKLYWQSLQQLFGYANWIVCFLFKSQFVGQLGIKCTKCDHTTCGCGKNGHETKGPPIESSPNSKLLLVWPVTHGIIIMASWHHGIMASWHHGIMASWHHGIMASSSSSSSSSWSWSWSWSWICLYHPPFCTLLGVVLVRPEPIPELLEAGSNFQFVWDPDGSISGTPRLACSLPWGCWNLALLSNLNLE